MLFFCSLIRWLILIFLLYLFLFIIYFVLFLLHFYYFIFYCYLFVLFYLTGANRPLMPTRQRGRTLRASTHHARQTSEQATKALTPATCSRIWNMIIRMSAGSLCVIISICKGKRNKIEKKKIEHKIKEREREEKEKII